MRAVECAERSCRHNRNCKCTFLNKQGESNHNINGEKLVMLCAWEECGRTERCKSCKFYSFYKGKEWCDLKKKLIPRGRKACGYYQTSKI